MLKAAGLAVRFGGVKALDDFCLTVGDGEVVSVLGPSGCGKSTLLRALAGLQPLEAGQVYWNGESLAEVPPHLRRFGLMFQDYALFPHKTVAGNVGFGLRMAGLSGPQLRRRVEDALALVGLEDYASRTVGTLSGGEQQRVALARALAPEPRLLMLDEPLGSLDRALKDMLLSELHAIFKKLGTTALYVTHDQEEAFSVADRLVLMRAGRVVQEGAPEEVWRQPTGEWVARFLGLNGIFDARVDQGWATAPWGSFPIGNGTAGPSRLLLRPDALELMGVNDGPEIGTLEGEVVHRTFRGGHCLVSVRIPGGPTLQVEVPLPLAPEPGGRVRLRIRPEEVVLLPE